MKITQMKVRLTLTNEALGMMPASQEIYRDYIASNAPDAAKLEEEIAESGIDGIVEKGTTVFPRLEDGRPFFWDYQLRGMIKDAIGMLRRVPGTACSKAKAYKKLVDGLIFVKERKAPIEVNGECGSCQRPLRTDGPTGSRTALASSESVPAGSTVECTFILLSEDVVPIVRECLDYGVLRGLGQWRNAGKGRFTWEVIEG